MMEANHLEMKVVMEEMKRVRAFVFSLTREAHLSEAQAQDLHLIVEEAIANIVNYSGATRMSLSALHENGCLYITVTDDGTPFDPTQYPPPNLTVPAEERQVGGLGIHYMNTMSDGLVYRREDGMNILTIKKLI